MKQNKQYAIERSPLYRLKRADLATVLKVDEYWLQRFLDMQKKPYNCFSREDGKGKVRDFEEPLGILKRVQKQIHTYLLRIEPPAYLYSPAKGRSAILNAALHRKNRIVRTMDISRFFPSTKREMVYRFFRYGLQCSGGASETLTELCILNEHLPTGASTSPIIAFYAYRPMWEKMKALVVAENCIFSLIVDDITVSGDNVPGSLIWQLEKLLNSYGLQCHPKKKRLYKEGSSKEITGVIIKGNRLLMPNRLHKKMHELVFKSRKNVLMDLQQPLNDSINGLKSYQTQIEAYNH